jgi:hypothetical protein
MPIEAEDVEMTYEDYDICNSVDPAVAGETRDFVDECILLLHVLERPKPNSENWESHLHNYNESDRKHIILFNWIALSLVREAHGDVAAVAIYRLKDKPDRIYYAKNNLSSADEAHVKEFADLVRLAASTTMPIAEFQIKYFSLLHKNCIGKLKRRVDALRATIHLRDKQIGNQVNNSNPSPTLREEFRNLLETSIKSNAVPPYSRNRADKTALKMVSDTTNIFAALLKIYDSMKSVLFREEDAHMLAKLCNHCFIIGSSSVLEESTKSNRPAHEVVKTAEKLGEYCRGISHLYGLLDNEESKASFATFECFPVPSTPIRTVQLSTDWFHVIETIYTLVEGGNLPVSKDKLYEELNSQVMNYIRFRGEFTRHAEIALIEYLVKNNLAPTVIGISKMSCFLCNAWINGLNAGNRKKWKVSGCHGRFYPWARDANPGPLTAAAESKAQNAAYDRLMELISKFIPDPGESPVHTDTVERGPSTPFELD